MKFSKSYLKQVITEEIQKLNEEQKFKQKVIDFSAIDFLKLTTDEKEYPLSDLASRLSISRQHAKNKNINIRDLLSANEDFFLKVDKKSNVINHEGRMRTFFSLGEPKTLNDQGLQDKNIKITFIYDEEIDHLSPYLYLKNQFNKNIEVSIKNPLYVHKKQEIVQLEDLIDEKFKKEDLAIKLRNIAVQNKSTMSIDNINNILQQYVVVNNNIPERLYGIQLSKTGLYGAVKFIKPPLIPELSWNDSVTLRKK